MSITDMQDVQSTWRANLHTFSYRWVRRYSTLFDVYIYAYHEMMHPNVMCTQTRMTMPKYHIMTFHHATKKKKTGLNSQLLTFVSTSLIVGIIMVDWLHACLYSVNVWSTTTRFPTTLLRLRGGVKRIRAPSAGGFLPQSNWVYQSDFNGTCNDLRDW